jgi:hypothetical protein
MNLTPEKREALLIGASDYRGGGFADASSAPKRLADRIVEIRQAIIERRPIPEPTAEYRAAADFAQKLFRTPARANQRTVSEPTTTNVDHLRRLMTAARIF